MNKIDIKCVAAKGAVIPQYKTAGAAGADICALLESDVVLKKGERAMIPTGLFFEIPAGYEIQVRPRSGLAAKNGVTVLNTPGTIDSNYRNEVKVILVNLSGEDYEVHKGDRIAQLIFTPSYEAAFFKVDSLDDSDRGQGGFGSTGK